MTPTVPRIAPKIGAMRGSPVCLVIFPAGSARGIGSGESPSGRELTIGEAGEGVYIGPPTYGFGSIRLPA